jgi:hypothetical protein
LLEIPQELIRTVLDLKLQDGTLIADRVGRAYSGRACIARRAQSPSG